MVKVERLTYPICSLYNYFISILILVSPIAGLGAKDKLTEAYRWKTHVTSDAYYETSKPNRSVVPPRSSEKL